ncbi:hypothetical protein MMC14_003726 [Varicellaria rhodocarpa]|nr:hypothetical protein [Varicellaria rhodocarpa]
MLHNIEKVTASSARKISVNPLRSHNLLIQSSRMGRLNSTSCSSSSSNKSTSPSPNTQNPAVLESQQQKNDVGDGVAKSTDAKVERKTMAERDEELRLKLEGISGEGGAAGLELEDGKPVVMKRGVKNNMFRLI